MHVLKDKKILKTKRPRQLWISLAAFVVFMIGIVFLLQPWRTIKTVSINTMMIPTDKIATYANINQQTPYWRIGGQTKFIAQHIVKQDDQIDSAQVTLQGNNVNINIVEKVTAGYIEQGNNWYIINREGMFKKVQTPEGNAPVYANFKTNKDVKKLAKAFVSLELTLRQNISQIIFSPNKDNANRLIIIMNDGNTVYATLDTFGKKINYYPGIAAQMPVKGIVDLQFGAYSYAYGTSQANTTNKKSDHKDKQK